MAKLTMHKFRENYKEFIKREIGSKFVRPINIINAGYPYTFNASFDGLLKRETKSVSLVDIKNPVNFATIQPCIRTPDKPLQKKSLLHLSLFDMCGYIVLDVRKAELEELIEKTIKEFFVYYTKYLKLDPKLLIIYYFGGGTLRKISSGTVASDKFIEPDIYSPKIWKSLGLKEDQLIKESSRETFLLYTGMPPQEHHSGYRNDVFISLNKQKFELATLHFITHKSVMKEEKIAGISPLNFWFRGFASGAERCLAAINATANLYELPHIQPLYKLVLEKVKNQTKAMVATDALRTIHYVISDGWTHDKLQGKNFRKQRQELNKYFSLLLDFKNLFNENDLVKLLTTNVQIQPWYLKLEPNIDTVITEIRNYQERRK